MLANEEDIRKADALLSALRPLRLTWLEALVFHHYYWHGLDFWTMAEVTGQNPRDLAQARRTLVTKAAAALGYIEPPDELQPITMPLPMTVEERTRVAEELRQQGLTWKEIGERLGANPDTLAAYHRRRGPGRKAG